MINFLYFTDSHFKKKRPKYRIDDFYENVKKKLDEVIQIFKEEECEYLLHGGDLFDDEAHADPQELLEDIGMVLPKNTFVAIGNHDLKKKGTETKGTLLGVLRSFGIIKVPEGDFIIKDGKNKILIRFIHYTQKKKDLMLPKDFNGSSIIVIHDMVVPADDGIKYEHIPIESIKTDFDLVLSGHYHFPFQMERKIGKKNVIFKNPGSLIRLTTKDSDSNRIPMVTLISANNGSFCLRDIPLKSALKPKLAFDFEKSKQDKQKKKTFSEFREGISGGIEEFKERHEITDEFKNFCKENNVKDKDVEGFSLQKIEEAKEENVKVKY